MNHLRTSSSNTWREKFYRLQKNVSAQVQCSAGSEWDWFTFILYSSVPQSHHVGQKKWVAEEKRKGQIFGVVIKDIMQRVTKMVKTALKTFMNG